MRVLVHDYVGHPSHVQLSRALAARGHEVRHVYARFFPAPKGPLGRTDSDLPNFHVDGLDIGEAFARRGFAKRARQERAYGRLVAREVARMKPDVVISSHMPLAPQAILARACRAEDAAFVFWLQDIAAHAKGRVLRRRVPILGGILGAHGLYLERRLLRRADAVVAISADFLPTLRAWDVSRARIEVVENWAPIEDLPVRPRANPWRAAHRLDDKLVFLYAGTLGAKHNPALLLALAHRMSGRADARVVVISEGPGTDWLAAHKSSLPADNLTVLPFQPFAAMPEALAAADVLVAALEPEAGVYHVPSKVLTYMCASRPILAALPADNLAARTILRARAGPVIAPEDERGFLDAAERLAADARLRAELGAAGRAHAETHFRIDRIAERFERLCETARASYVRRRRGKPMPVKDETKDFPLVGRPTARIARKRA